MSAHTRIYLLVTLLFIAIFGNACEKEITVELPDSEPKLVVEGRIEADGINKTPPIITLTKSSGYFEASSLEALAEYQVHGAVVRVTVDQVTYPLDELCVAGLDPALLPPLADFLGVSVEELIALDYCVYTVPVADLLSGNFLSGEVGKSYELTIVSEGITYRAKTKIPALNTLNDVWYEPALDDTFGFAWAGMTDPDTAGNAYRWYARRISHDKYGKEKDNSFIPPVGSAFDDKFIDGKTFDFAYDRGHKPGEHDEEDPTEIPHYFKRSDTVVIKFTTIDMGVARFLRLYEIEINSAGSPFASPTTIPTNIEGGGLGLWAGYGATYDTIFGTD